VIPGTALITCRLALVADVAGSDDVLFDVAGSILAANRVEAKYLFEEWRSSGKKAIWQIHHLAHCSVGKDHTQIAIHDRNPAGEVV